MCVCLCMYVYIYIYLFIVFDTNFNSLSLSLSLSLGTEMDWSEDDLAAEFTFINPNIKGECGCGESFNI